MYSFGKKIWHGVFERWCRTCTCYHQMGTCTRASGTMKTKHTRFLIIFFVDLFVDGTVSIAQITVLVRAVNSLQSRSSLRGCYGE